MDWHLLPPATESMIADVALAAQGRFTGDPSHEYEHTEMRIKGEGDDATEEEVTVRGEAFGLHNTDGATTSMQHSGNKKMNKSPSSLVNLVYLHLRILACSCLHKIQILLC